MSSTLTNGFHNASIASVSATPTISKQPSSKVADIQHHIWVHPRLDANQTQTVGAGLKVWNSLTRSKVDFVPIRDGHVSWYNCGPTVYDASHMGHARNYVSQDIIRRILRDYFGFNVHFVMNITDVDDKIILRARQTHLYDSFLSSPLASSPTPSPELITETDKAWDAFWKGSIVPLVGEGVTWEEVLEKFAKDEKWRKEMTGKEEKFSLWIGTLRTARTAIQTAQSHPSTPTTTLLSSTRDILSPYLDSLHGSSITDKSIYRQLASFWERSFFDDMSRLNVERPTTLTRVSEYVPEIVAFVERIVQRGYAYETGGNVWFDTGRFDGGQPGSGREQVNQSNGALDPPSSSSSSSSSWTHTYAKLQPTSKGNSLLLSSGEGALTSGGKRSPADFALWKTSKPGEPAWDGGKWGAGRPGWHIECSVMASEVLGERMDVHSGGVDLMFPHHDNEIAQSEAYHDNQQWVNYFLHTGHLHIEGSKMSKSLKNFITIGNALKKYSARRLRLAFLRSLWSSGTDFSESDMVTVANIEQSFNNFFANVKARLEEARAKQEGERGAEEKVRHRHEELAKNLIIDLKSAQTALHAALLDSFNTPESIAVLSDLISKANIYMTKTDGDSLSIDAVTATEEWVTRTLRMFGLGEGPELDAGGKRVFGWGTKIEGDLAGVNADELRLPGFVAGSKLRDEMRKLAIDKTLDATSLRQRLLALSDHFRDVEMFEHGVQLDDRDSSKPSLVKLVPKSALLAEREKKEADAAQKAAEKEEKDRVRREKEEKDAARARIRPEEMFKSPNEGSEKWSEWDERGLPVRDREGKEVSKKAGKANEKEWERQRERWEKAREKEKEDR